MLIRPAIDADHAAIWAILEPVIRAGETYALPRDMAEGDGIAYWNGADRETFVAERDEKILGSYYIRANQAGGGAHVANCGYVTDAAANGQGIARRMCEHSLLHAKSRGFRAMQFNLVVATNTRAVKLWQSLGFETLAKIPGAFEHPRLGFVDALVMFRSL
jgi:ribosomal protein S18 acetylase RimI-like enzyme